MTEVVPVSKGEMAIPSLEAPADSPFSWLRSMTATIRDQMLTHGAVLIHGLPIDGPDSLGEARSFLGIGSFTPIEAFNHRRDFGNNILSPISWPQDRHICPVQESSFSRTFPSVVLTACVTPPEGDGRAYLVDARRMLQHLPADLADRVRTEGWIMNRAFHGGFGISWQQAFSATERGALEELFKTEGIDSEWTPNDSLLTTRHRPGIIKHPATGEECWFNQLSFLNASNLDPTERAFMARAFGKHLPMETFFGDGSPLSEEDVNAIVHAYDSVRVDLPWRRGDLLIADNMITALGRSAIEGSPVFLVALGKD
ncbi:TauD/TfdA family dioxygenase [Streptomyces sp. NPDC088190]|uniref:TauD/TfdA family dioxygenase n=1 Tax=unclassified Streptomyces TaxID=2593676 RepID=UPI002E7A7E8C|nr:TauD/TfdA family dioxygenase [Streptomyces sp. JV190]MEE1838766.1 TauD/TfdA family dioxygenase [Streptomyces sp. JV190]